ncbi:hypothetical protein GIB67_030945, partial [Kingdonia uniflora]
EFGFVVPGTSSSRPSQLGGLERESSDLQLLFIKFVEYAITNPSQMIGYLRPDSIKLILIESGKYATTVFLILHQINICNDFYCDYFSLNKAYKPKMWTEAWIGWFTAFRGTFHRHPEEDLAFSIVRFIQKGESFVNYYMAHVFNYHAEGCAAFLMNSNSKSYATVTFRNMHYNLPPLSISILPECKNTVFNTAKVRSLFLCFLLSMFPPLYIEV